MLLYQEEGKVYLETEEHSNPVAAYYSRRCLANDQPGFQPMLSESSYFYSLTHLPVDTDGDWVRAAGLFDAFKNAAQYIFCFMINKSGNEFQVVWPKTLDEKEHEQIVDSFLRNAQQVWTHTEYQDQSAAYVCDPQIWFYENRPPIRE
jgi:hypothetical protein